MTRRIVPQKGRAHSPTPQRCPTTVLIVATLLGMLVVGPTATLGQTPVPTVNIHASILVNSGLPDPAWEFTDPADVARLRRFISALPAASAPTNWPDLGFRGFLLTADEGKTDFPGWVRVFQGAIEITVHGASRYFQDKNGLEAFMTAEAQKRGLGQFISPGLGQ